MKVIEDSQSRIFTIKDFNSGNDLTVLINDSVQVSIIDGSDVRTYTPKDALVRLLEYLTDKTKGVTSE